MTRALRWGPLAAVLGGVTVFWLGWSIGWIREVPIDDAFEGLGGIAGSGAFGGVITSGDIGIGIGIDSFELVGIALAVLVAVLIGLRFSGIGAIVGGLLVASIGVYLLTFTVDTGTGNDDLFGSDVASGPWALSIVGTLLVVLAGLVWVATGIVRYRNHRAA